MLGDLSRNYGSLEELADEYVAEIVRKQPQGPYHLLGWSLGGALAAMISARLEGRGNTVEFLGMVDSFIPRAHEDTVGNEREQSWKDDFKEQFHLIVPSFEIVDSLPDLDEPEDVDAIAALIDAFIKKAAVAGHVRKEVYAALGTEDMARMFIVGRRLTKLSARATRLQVLCVEPYYWWSRGRTAEAKIELGQQLGSSMAERGTVIQADHADMVHFPALLNEVVACLVGLEGVISETS